MGWTFFETALDGAEDASAALNTLAASFLPELGETLAAIGAEQATPLIEEATRAAEPPDRRAKLEAVLDIIDPALDVYAPLTTVRTQNLRSIKDWEGPGAELGDVTRVALLAALIDTSLGGDAETLRRRALLAATTMKAHFLTQKDLRPEKDRDDDYSAGSRALEKVLRLGLRDLQPRRQRFRFGRRT